jgi:hypothetical protein
LVDPARARREALDGVDHEAPEPHVGRDDDDHGQSRAKKDDSISQHFRRRDDLGHLDLRENGPVEPLDVQGRVRGKDFGSRVADLLNGPRGPGDGQAGRLCIDRLREDGRLIAEPAVGPHEQVAADEVGLAGLGQPGHATHDAVDLVHRHLEDRDPELAAVVKHRRADKARRRAVAGLVRHEIRDEHGPGHVRTPGLAIDPGQIALAVGPV